MVSTALDFFVFGLDLDFSNLKILNLQEKLKKYYELQDKINEIVNKIINK